MIAIKHLNLNTPIRATLAFRTPPKVALLEMFEKQLERLYLNVGCTFVHPKEQYVKKTGVAEAKRLCENDLPKYCTLKNIQPRDSRWVYHFECLVPDVRPVRKRKYCMVKFGLSMCLKSEQVNLEYAELVEN